MTDTSLFLSLVVSELTLLFRRSQEFVSVAVDRRHVVETSCASREQELRNVLTLLLVFDLSLPKGQSALPFHHERRLG